MRVFLAACAGVIAGMSLMSHLGMIAPRGPQYIRVEPLTNSMRELPACEGPLAVLEGQEVLVLRRNGATADLVVMHGGAVRGTLLTIDLDNKALVAPSRPPFGWSIGGR